MKKHRAFMLLLTLFAVLFFLNNIDLGKMLSLPDEFYVSYDEIDRTNKEKGFGKLVSLSFDKKEISTGQTDCRSGEIVFKLFGFIPIKKINAKILPEEKVFVGGMPIGLSMQTDGAVVISNSIVVPENTSIIKNQVFEIGDIITEIDNVSIHSTDDIVSTIEGLDKENVVVKFINKNQYKEREINLLKDSEGNYKMGLWVKDNFSGVGTLTFVADGKQGFQFGALGHPITNNGNENIIPVNDGQIYSCSLVNILKGEKNSPGELRCVFVPKDRVGNLKKNTNVGVFGTLDGVDKLIDQNRTAMLGGRLSVKPGPAKILSSVSGILEEYDIEIIKASYQTKSADKSLIFRVKDQRLIDLTGGIVQGMSGSPIIQDDKIVGAVTHVFLTDPTKGFGIYSDWMIEQLN